MEVGTSQRRSLGWKRVRAPAAKGPTFLRGESLIKRGSHAPLGGRFGSVFRGVEHRDRSGSSWKEAS